MELTSIKGLGAKTESILIENGIKTPFDLVTFFPVRYAFFELSPIEEASPHELKWFEGVITKKPSVFNVRKNLTRITVEVSVKERVFTLVVFNQTYLLRLLNINEPIVFLAKVDLHYKQVTAQSIRLKRNFEEGIKPVYGIDHVGDQKMLDFIHQTLPGLMPKFRDKIPSFLREKYKLIYIKTFMQEVHEPTSEKNLKQVYRRLKYEELFLYQLKVQELKYLRGFQKGSQKHYDIDKVKAYINHLPFDLTQAQKQATNTLFKDLKSPHVMKRMLQGDTGSGKTVVAFLAMIAVITAGQQVAFMAPTEILANQHFDTFNTLFGNHKFIIERLTGSLNLSDRNRVKKGLREGIIDAVIGTHALLSKDLSFQQLGLVITDEQHRFGVSQRDTLKHKGSNPDILYLSATPIPRTLAMTLFSDIDLTVIQEKPRGRMTITTELAPLKQARKFNQMIESTLSKQEQIYIVAPRIDNDEDSSLVSTEQLYKYYKKTFPNTKIGLLHGKIKAKEKDGILKAFQARKIDILVSTTVIEVGIHVDYATLMLIFHAERFGYAQIHQLRGRVGRSHLQGQCILLYQGDEYTAERLSVLETTYDGFKLSEFDLKNRGFGDVLGTLQSGHKTFKYSNDFEDFKILKLAKDDAKEIVERYHNDELNDEKAISDYLLSIKDL